MRTLWRISKYADLSGDGALYASGRWHTKGNPIVYLAETPAGAMVERLVHLSDLEGPLPRTYDLLEVTAPDEVGMRELLPLADVDWRARSDSTRRLGDAWLTLLETPLARVPSAVVPRTWNVLLNPLHPDAVHLRVVSVARERFDNRLFRFGGY